MLVVKTEVLPSSIKDAGLGLFLLEDVPEGGLIWIDVPSFRIQVADKDLPLLPPPAAEFTRKYGALQEGIWYISGDNSRFANHSDDPTCRDEGTTSVAVRFLPAGTELTWDYRNLCETSPGEPYVGR